jgi:hypothetical protein
MITQEDAGALAKQLRLMADRIEFSMRDPAEVAPDAKEVVENFHAITADRKTFGARLRAERSRKGYRTATAAARLCGIPQGTWFDYESSRIVPQAERLAHMITTLGLDIRNLMPTGTGHADEIAGGHADSDDGDAA